MQKLVSSATQQVVYSVKCGVLLGRAQSAVLICYEHSLIAELFLLEAGFRLTASADAAAGAQIRSGCRPSAVSISNSERFSGIF